MKYTKEYLKNNLVAIRVTSEHELQAIYSLMTGFKNYKEFISGYCYTFNGPFSKTSVEYNPDNGWYEKESYEVINFQQFLLSNNDNYEIY